MTFVVRIIYCDSAGLAISNSAIQLLHKLQRPIGYVERAPKRTEILACCLPGRMSQCGRHQCYPYEIFPHQDNYTHRADATPD